MALTKKIIQLWHDLYYFGRPQRRIAFALKCKEVSEIVDLGTQLTRSKNFRYELHLSLCQPCRNYRDVTIALRDAARLLLGSRRHAVDINAMNERLLKQFKK